MYDSNSEYFVKNTILEKRACFSSSECLKLIGGLGSWLLDQRVGRRVSVLVTWLVYLTGCHIAVIEERVTGNKGDERQRESFKQTQNKNFML